MSPRLKFILAAGVLGLAGLYLYNYRVNRAFEASLAPLRTSLIKPRTVNEHERDFLAAILEQDISTVRNALRDDQIRWPDIATPALRLVVDLDVIAPKPYPQDAEDREFWIDVADRMIKFGANPQAGLAKATTVAEAEFFLARGATIDGVESPTAAGTLLYWRAADLYADLESYLLKKGANPNAKAHAGNTPLHEAARHDAVKVIALLINHGANINATNDAGQTPLDLAHQFRATAAAALLKNHGATARAP